ncbi:glycosyltransferase family 39 protein [uncultured Sphingomonas sp.]|uniref:glycosyltransferase family 39 protein n=1 Tax=uncultured Sphingomonas sp. TaxID=158754 RepID=UPI00262199C9|nr:glycosyltransferase family 39 protein [uncultured Sphingomonas sp.]
MTESDSRISWRWLALLIGAAALALWVGWIGFIASDDSLYYAGAQAWLTHPPAAGADHWSTRFPLILTFAGVIAVMGRGYAAFAVTAVLFYVLLVVLVGFFARGVGGRRAGWIAALLTATLPVIVARASTVSVDLIEASALIAGAMLLAGARDDHAGLWRGGGAGLCFGIAILCRETSVLALAAFVPMFAIGRPVPRRVLFAAGVGLALALGAETLFQYAMTGDPLRRYSIAFHHDEHIDRAANMEGNFLLWPPIDPLLVLLINDDFGLLFWLAGLALALGVTRGLGETQWRRLTILAAMAGTSFVLVAVLYTKLVLNPRYFTLAAIVAVVVLALWLDRLAGRWRALLLAAIIGGNLVLMSVGNMHPRWEMEALVDAARRHPREIVAGDPHDVRRARIPMAFARLDNLRYAPAAPGGLIVAPAEAMPPGVIVARYPSSPTRLGAALRALGLEAFVPHAIARRMFAPSPEMVLIRTHG